MKCSIPITLTSSFSHWPIIVCNPYPTSNPDNFILSLFNDISNFLGYLILKLSLRSVILVTWGSSFVMKLNYDQAWTQMQKSKHITSKTRHFERSTRVSQKFGNICTLTTKKRWKLQWKSSLPQRTRIGINMRSKYWQKGHFRWCNIMASTLNARLFFFKLEE